MTTRQTAVDPKNDEVNETSPAAVQPQQPEGPLEDPEGKTDSLEKSNEIENDAPVAGSHAKGMATDQPGDTSNDNDGSDNEIGDTTSGDGNATEVSPVVLRRPAKRSRTAYFIFADEMRPTIQREHPGEGVAAQAKRIGAKWKSISQEEKERFQSLAAEEKQKVAAELEAYRAKYGDAALEDDGVSATQTTSDDDLIFPVARIRKIAKLDPEVKTLSKEALQLVVKSAELALAKLGKECVKVARIQNRRTLLPDDVAHVCSHREVFSFLKDDIQDLTKALAQHKEMTGGGKENNSLNKNEAARKEAATGSKPLTSYFASRK